MMNWTIDLDVHVTASRVDLIDLVQDYLDALDAYPGIYGPVTAVNVETQTVSATFDVETTSFEEILMLVPRWCADAIVTAGAIEVEIVHVEATKESAEVPVPDRELLHA